MPRRGCADRAAGTPGGRREGEGEGHLFVRHLPLARSHARARARVAGPLIRS